MGHVCLDMELQVDVFPENASVCHSLFEKVAVKNSCGSQEFVGLEQTDRNI